MGVQSCLLLLACHYPDPVKNEHNVFYKEKHFDGNASGLQTFNFAVVMFKEDLFTFNSVIVRNFRVCGILEF